MHDITEVGLLGGLFEAAMASNKGEKNISMKKVRISKKSVKHNQEHLKHN